ncbi:hypothetical protein HSX44_02715 [Wolbachia endosymbiont of Onchocerca gibsoni]|nr:hypothetical protein [Wolbachia endosymbiont of Onchocerca gibsoni]MDF0607792.1 hypothetical protein [Wolbachia endosymbiont of Onchocerca gibsoni]
MKSFISSKSINLQIKTQAPLAKTMREDKMVNLTFNKAYGSNFSLIKNQ